MKIEPGWKDLVKCLGDIENQKTCAKIILYGVNTSRPLPPGSILGKITSQEGKKVNLALMNPVSPDKLLKEIKSEFNRETSSKIKELLGGKLSRKKKVKKLKFDRERVRDLETGKVPGISGKWHLKASGGTWSIYTNQAETKVLKAPHAAQNGWESAILALTHEKVAETIEEKYRDSGLQPPENHSLAVLKVEDSKMAVTVMDYEKNYVSGNIEGLKKVQKALKNMHDSGELPAHEFDYDDEGIDRRNLAYRNGKFIALDLCDKSVLENDKYLEKHRIPEKARELGFQPPGDKSMLSGLFNRFF